MGLKRQFDGAHRASEEKRAAAPSDQNPSANPNPNAKSTPLKRATADGTLSCAECRRLKFKCDRRWPCSKCRERNCAHLCPDNTLETRKVKTSSAKTDDALLQRIALLEKTVERFVGGTGDARPAAYGGDSQDARQSTTLASHASARPPLTGSYSADEERMQHAALHSLADAAIQPRESAESSYTTSNISPNRGIPISYQSAGPEALDSRGRGTLALSRDGRTYYVGPNAQSMYFARDTQRQEESDVHTRPGSPVPPVGNALGARGEPVASPYENDPGSTMIGTWTTPGICSPHSSSAIIAHLRPKLPSREQAKHLTDLYFINMIMWEPISRQEYDQSIFDLFYANTSVSCALEGNVEVDRTDQSALHPHRLAILFVVLSIGTIFDVRSAAEPEASREYYSYSWAALSLSNVTEAPSLEALIALHLIGFYLNSRRGGRYVESYWGISGLAMRLAIAMGLHRDPGTWNLPQPLTQRRRRVFWELWSLDCFRAIAFCRPPALFAHHMDVEAPQQWNMDDPFITANGVFHAMKCKINIINSGMLDQCLCSNKAEYSDILNYDAQFRAWLNSTPPQMQPTVVRPNGPSREDEAAFLAKAERDNARREAELSSSRPATIEAMRNDLQAHVHVFNCHQSLLLLHRAWFARELHRLDRTQDDSAYASKVRQSDSDPLTSPCAKSITTVLDAGASIIELVRSAFVQHTYAVLRQYYMWVAAFSAAAVQSLWVVRCPGHPLSKAALLSLEHATNLFTAGARLHETLSNPLNTLRRLLRKADLAIAVATGSIALRKGSLRAVQDGQEEDGDSGHRTRGTSSSDGEDGGELDLVGEETRLLSDRRISGSRADYRQQPGLRTGARRLPTSKTEDDSSRNAGRGSLHELVPTTPKGDPRSAVDTSQGLATLAYPLESLHSSAQDPNSGASYAPIDFDAESFAGLDDAGQLLNLLSRGLPWDGWDFPQIGAQF
ncbi:hypothetical protein IE81DRAFT_323712 [Ceraceosorus guamensis]|uniref:Zn(2)-C6 fungal-type domain-containing protein n=1 Tax=Ceraceosorus guamensis TaxID=1522189 RepID=A0A316VXP7_9BASI|nr:hypothetical protein IE81DRAFT_323712 [Ceraceosorus guamensis]PWN42229.1 hypothetical protein IE81DRAFT_323712 [Ceraceosorus guamensis]